MGYVSTRMKKEINIESIVTIHYFEYMKNFVFQGESHDFWELLYVDKGEVSVRAENEWLTLHAGDIIFHRPNEFHAFESIGKSSKPCRDLLLLLFTRHALVPETTHHSDFRRTYDHLTDHC